MDKIKYHAVIKYFVLNGVTPMEIKTELVSTLRDVSPLSLTVKKLVVELNVVVCP